MPLLSDPREITRRFDVIRDTFQQLSTKISPHYRKGKWVSLSPRFDSKDVMLGYNKDRYWMRTVRCDTYQNQENLGILHCMLLAF